MTDRTTSPTDPAAIGGHVCPAADAFAARYPRRHNWNDGEWCVVKDDLARWLRRLEPRAAFEGLLWVAENRPDLPLQLLVGELLHRMGRRCPLPRCWSSHLPAHVRRTLVKPSGLHCSLPTPWWTKKRPAGSYFSFTAASLG